MQILEKKVSMTELFYDLIFVCALGKMTGMIHHLHRGIIEPLTYAKYIIVIIFWINVWMIQAVFNNRYGDDDTADQLFLYFDMFLLLFLLNSTGENWRDLFVSSNTLIVLITLSQILQYTRQFFKRKEDRHNDLIRVFLYILAFKAIFISIGAALPYDIGVYIALTSMVISWLLPLLFIPTMKKYPVNFPNLIERMTLLIILAFGESFISMVPYFNPSYIFNSVLIFISVVALFYFYKTYFDKIIDHHNTNSSGGGLIYFHYIILIGLGNLTVTIDFINDPAFEVNSLFLVNFLYGGLILFYSGIFLHFMYNKKSHAFIKNCIVKHYLILGVGYLISLYFKELHLLITGIVTLITLYSALNMWHFERIRK